MGKVGVGGGGSWNDAMEDVLDSAVGITGVGGCGG